jgi:hypothetical protein
MKGSQVHHDRMVRLEIKMLRTVQGDDPKLLRMFLVIVSYMQMCGTVPWGGRYVEI